jgi:uncharacterized protein (TIGR00297 family)
MPIVHLLAGTAAAAVIGWTAYHYRSLTASGGLAASVVGAIILGVGGWPWAALLLAFFLSSSLLSNAFRGKKRSLEEASSKGTRRDAGQVIGNGAVPAFFALIHGILPSETWPWVGFAASLAAVNADTWATEVGVLSPTAPRLITQPSRAVPAGTSGGISVPGLLAAGTGAAFIATLAILLAGSAGVKADGGAWIGILAAGMLGSLFDSGLGATVQTMYYCPREGKETEKHPRHGCGTATLYLRGWRWLNNDWVNLGCAAFGATVVLVLNLS